MYLLIHPLLIVDCEYTFQKIERDGFLVLYKSKVRLILEYGAPIWYPDLKKPEKEIETIQRKATK